MLHMRNTCAYLFNYIKDVTHIIPNFSLKFTTRNTFHTGRSNLLNVSEAAAVFVANDIETPPDYVDFVICSIRTGALTKILYLKPLSCPASFLLLFQCFIYVSISSGSY